MKITKIYHPHKKRKADRTNLRVAAYCRVSTSSEDQLNSFETQKSVFTEMIEAHEGWKLVDIYADRGLSGTRASKRPQFLRMIEDCECGLIDIILSDDLPRPVYRLYELLRKGVVEGRVIPFQGVIYDREGGVHGTEGVPLTSAEIMTMDWLAENVFDAE